MLRLLRSGEKQRMSLVRPPCLLRVSGLVSLLCASNGVFWNVGLMRLVIGFVVYVVH